MCSEIKSIKQCNVYLSKALQIVNNFDLIILRDLLLEPMVPAVPNLNLA